MVKVGSGSTYAEVVYRPSSDKLAVVQNGTLIGTVTQYIYDAEGRRVAKLNAPSLMSGGTLSCSPTPAGQATATYILDQSGNQVAELDGSGNWKHTNVYADGRLLATYDQEGSQQLLHFNISDPLGTKRVQTSAFGVVELECLSLPYGDALACNNTGSVQDATVHHFTGKERDTESGLDYFGARYYASSMGRFMSPDWSKEADPVPFADLENPQSLNLYSYVRNNPLTRADSNGHDPYTITVTVTLIECPVCEAVFWTGVGVGAAYLAYHAWQQNQANKAPAPTAPAQTATPPNPNGNFKNNPKHGKYKKGDVSAAPKDGQTALDNSTQVKDTSPRRVGVDAANNEIVVLDQTSEGEFHGYVRAWDELTSQMQNALKDANLTTSNGTIIKP